MLTKNEALQELVFDSLQELGGFVCRIELQSFQKSKKLVIVFSSFLGLKEWRAKEALILAKMRELYKERGLKNVASFNKVVGELQGGKLLYKERSTGEFKNFSNTPEIKAFFERIRVKIKENLQKEQ